MTFTFKLSKRLAQIWDRGAFVPTMAIAIVPSWLFVFATFHLSQNQGADRPAVSTHYLSDYAGFSSAHPTNKEGSL